VGIPDSIISQLRNIQSQGAKLSCECSHGFLVEAMKKVMLKRGEAA